MDMKQKRGYDRIDYHSKAVLRFDNKSFSVTIENLSPSGALISKKDFPTLKLEDEVIIAIPFKNQSKTFEIKGRVARFVGDEVGVEFSY
jgi:hypothetical protein